MDHEKVIDENINANNIIGKTFDDYYCGKLIGSGGFGKVYQGTKLSNQEKVALKVIDQKQISQNGNNNMKKLLKRLARDQGINLQKCQSQNIVRCLGILTNSKVRVIIMEYCKDGTLTEYLQNRELQQYQIVDIMRQLISGLKELHRNDIIHRDIKADNILIHDGAFKIADLGVSKFQADTIVATRLGTVFTTSPQILSKQKYRVKTDVWSMGVILYRMVYGKYPYPTMQTNYDRMYSIIKSKKLNFNVQGVSPQMANLVSKMLKIDQDLRIDSSQILNEEVFKKDYKNSFKISKIYHQQTLQKQQTLRSTKYQRVQELARFARSQMLIQLTQQQILNKMKDKQHQKYLQHHFDSLKAEFIFKQIILLLEQNSYLSMQNRLNVQLLFLLTQRCYLYLSYFKDDINQGAKQLLRFPKTIQLGNLYTQIKNRFNKCQNKLRQIQNSFPQKIKDFIVKIFQSRQQINLKQKIFNGIQGIDCFKIQQISFTQKYISEFLPVISKKHKRLINTMNLYTQINNINYQNVYKNKSNFDQQVTCLLNYHKQQ